MGLAAPAAGQQISLRSGRSFSRRDVILSPLRGWWGTNLKSCMVHNRDRPRFTAPLAHMVSHRATASSLSHRGQLPAFRGGPPAGLRERIRDTDIALAIVLAGIGLLLALSGVLYARAEPTGFWLFCAAGAGPHSCLAAWAGEQS